jgi:hypothetical protein
MAENRWMINIRAIFKHKGESEEWSLSVAAPERRVLALLHEYHGRLEPSLMPLMNTSLSLILEADVNFLKDCLDTNTLKEHAGKFVQIMRVH